MSTWKVYVSKIAIGVVVAFFLFFLTTIFSPATEDFVNVTLSVVITLFMAMCYEVISLKHDFEHMKDKFAIETKTINAKSDELFHKMYSVLKVSEKRYNDKTTSAFGLIKHCVGNIDSEVIPEAWMDLCWDIQTEYLALNYEKDEYAYKPRWSDTGIDIQNAKCRKNEVVIKKIFLVDNVSELVRMKDMIDKHIYNGIKVSYITIDELKKTRGIREFPRLLYSLDFSIVNSDTLFLWKLNENRKCENGKLSFCPDEVKQYRKAFYKILHQSTPINHICDIPGAMDLKECKVKSQCVEKIA
ncbi:hypothetical protein C4G38_RS23695 [Vibrio parahaemolyticus]|nr:hypothetical protein [Vibrio parahaemolyticus]EJG0740412.1 hypothetical protein [Vibrio parahaemolyticus]EJG0918953.1 hypothetical protein [Vibrio parahaemolyticus]HCE2442283.1 hypothetical protein [Vibrio parahaemolyticus]